MSPWRCRTERGAPPLKRRLALDELVEPLVDGDDLRVSLADRLAGVPKKAPLTSAVLS